MVPINWTCLHCLQHSFLEHLFNLNCSIPDVAFLAVSTTWKSILFPDCGDASAVTISITYYSRGQTIKPMVKERENTVLFKDEYFRRVTYCKRIRYFFIK